MPHPAEVVIVVGPTDPAKSGSLTQADLDRARAEAGAIFLGERREVESLYPGFDLFVLASHREGFPRAAMEGAACGLPIVASDIRGCRQVVDHGHTGLLVPARDAVALADAIATLAADPIRRQAMGRAAAPRGGGVRRPQGDRPDARYLPPTSQWRQRQTTSTWSSRGRSAGADAALKLGALSPAQLDVCQSAVDHPDWSV